MAKQVKTEEYYVAKASARYIGIPARKARYVADLIRGKTVREALNLLTVTPRPSAVPMMRRLLLSAVSNVDRKQYSNTDNLVISRINVDVGPIMKRIQPHAMGRAFRIRKRMCHVSIGLGEM
ncbi:50S ribosomal protein L22 [Candidatus Sumerlaeota bacterium]|nr:50S ribosomal protein L22 [Candidatus Sumerlaeota bacterium]